MTLNFKGMFDAHSQSNKRVFSHDRQKTLGASESFGCLRKAFFAKRGYKPDEGFEQSSGATDRGSLLEAHYVVPALQANLPPNVEHHWMGEEQVTLVDGLLSATPDGLLSGLPRDALSLYGVPDIEGDEILVEIKSFDPRLALKEPKPVHVGQAQQQMGIVREVTNHRPEYCVILYVNASWLDDIRVFVVKRDPAVYAAAKKRADMVFTAKDPSEIAPEGLIKGGSECEYCPFSRQCHLAQIGSIPAKGGKPANVDKDEADRLRILTARYEELAARQKEVKTFLAETKEELKALIRAAGNRSLRTADGYSVSISTVAGRTSLDVKRLAEDAGLDLADYEKVGDPTERLRVKTPDGSQEDES